MSKLVVDKAKSVFARKETSAESAVFWLFSDATVLLFMASAAAK